MVRILYQETEFLCRSKLNSVANIYFAAYSCFWPQNQSNIYFDLCQKYEKTSPQNEFSRLVLTGTITTFIFNTPELHLIIPESINCESGWLPKSEETYPIFSREHLGFGRNVNRVSVSATFILAFKAYLRDISSITESEKG